MDIFLCGRKTERNTLMALKDSCQMEKDGDLKSITPSELVFFKFINRKTNIKLGDRILDEKEVKMLMD